MKNDIFNKHVEDQIQRCEDMLFRKEDEYAGKNPDRLHNFKAFADLAGVSQEQACGGYLGKHLVSIYDMIKGTGEGVSYDLSKWDEKIGDAINYLLILSAIVRETTPLGEVHGTTRKSNAPIEYTRISVSKEN